MKTDAIPSALSLAPLTALRQLWSQSLFPSPAAVDSRLHRGRLLLVLIGPALLLLPWNGFALLEPDEGRYAQIPREMLVRGEWIVPYLQGQPYLDKPPLFYWLVMASYSLFGVSPAAARLVPSLTVMGTIALVYLIGRRSVGERAAFTAAALLCVSPMALGVGRFLILDGLLMFLMTAALLCGFEAIRGERLLWSRWLLAGLACGLAGLTKGPVAVLLLLPPLLLANALSTAVRLRWSALAVLGGIVLLVNAPWYVAVWLRRPEFGGHFFWQHNLMRFLAPFDHLKPVWFYLPLLLAAFAPLLLATVPLGRFLLSASTAHRRSRELGFWLLAGGWSVFFFSLSGCKLPTYILPALPPLALAAGLALVACGWDDSRFWQSALALMACLMLGVQAIGLPWYAQQRSPMAHAETLTAWCADPATPIVCYPRSCDSAAFLLQRTDLRATRSKQVPELIAALHQQGRTVVLLTHRHSLEALRQALPRSLRMTSHTSLRHPPTGPWPIDALVTDSPQGLCDLVVIEHVKRRR